MVWAWGHRNPSFFVAEDSLKFAHQLGFKNVFDHIGISVDMAGSNLCMGHEIGFPEPVVSGYPGCFSKACFAEEEGVVGVSGDMFAMFLRSNDLIQFSGLPAALGE